MAQTTRWATRLLGLAHFYALLCFYNTCTEPCTHVSYDPPPPTTTCIACALQLIWCCIGPVQTSFQVGCTLKWRPRWIPPLQCWWAGLLHHTRSSLCWHCGPPYIPQAHVVRTSWCQSLWTWQQQQQDSTTKVSITAAGCSTACGQLGTAQQHRQHPTQHQQNQHMQQQLVLLARLTHNHRDSSSLGRQDASADQPPLNPK